MTRTRTPARSRGRRLPPPRRRPARRWPAWAALGGVALVVALMLLAAGGSPNQPEEGPAPRFSLAATDGGQVSLDDYRGRNVVLYFNEGVGCDACFYQMVELEKHGDHLADAGLTVVPVAVNPAGAVRQEMERFGLTTPFLVDPDRRVSAAYGTIGTGHHADLPGHSFVLVDGTGRLRWRGDYPGMFVPPDELIASAAGAAGRS